MRDKLEGVFKFILITFAIGSVCFSLLTMGIISIALFVTGIKGIMGL